MLYRNILLAVTTAYAITPLHADTADIIIQLGQQFDKNDQATDPAFIITRDAITTAGFESINAVFDAIPFTKITMDSVGDGTTGVIDMRGFGETSGSSVKVLLNGIPLNNPTNEAPNFSFIPIAAVESIEVTPGGGSIEHGAGAVGGVININTISGQIAPFNGITIQSGSFGQLTSSAYGVTQMSDSMSMGYSASHRRKDGFRHHTDTEQSFASLDFNYRIDPTRSWSFTVSSSDENRLATGAATDAALATDRRSVGSSISILDLDNTFLSGGYAIESSRGHSYRLKGFRRVSQQIANFDYGPNGTFEELSDQKTTLAGFNIQSSIPLSDDLKTILIADGEQSDYEKTSNFSGFLDETDRTRSRFGVAAKLIRSKKSETGTWKSTLGIRTDKMIDKNHLDSSEINYRGTGVEISQALNPSDNRTVMLKIIRGFRFPTFDENNFTVSGKPLSTQKSTQVELTARTPKWISSAYLLDIRDEIRFVDPANFLNGSYDKTRRIGVDVTRSFSLSDTLTAEVSFQYLKARIKEGSNQGRTIPALPLQTISPTIRWKPTSEWSHEARLQFQSGTFALNDPGNTLGQANTFTTLRLETAYKFKNFAMVASVNNLFDSEYDLYRIATRTLADIRRTPAEPRSFAVSLRYEF
ncbi:MAG: hypothetical protein EBS77_03615 [Gammaproteobacteria bacterium]|nr:hypothetical protein [Gammaproteobacteria bacterium]